MHPARARAAAGGWVLGWLHQDALAAKAAHLQHPVGAMPLGGKPAPPVPGLGPLEDQVTRREQKYGRGCDRARIMAPLSSSKLLVAPGQPRRRMVADDLHAADDGLQIGLLLGWGGIPGRHLLSSLRQLGREHRHPPRDDGEWGEPM